MYRVIKREREKERERERMKTFIFHTLEFSLRRSKTCREWSWGREKKTKTNKQNLGTMYHDWHDNDFVVSASIFAPYYYYLS